VAAGPAARASDIKGGQIGALAAKVSELEYKSDVAEPAFFDLRIAIGILDDPLVDCASLIRIGCAGTGDLPGVSLTIPTGSLARPRKLCSSEALSLAALPRVERSTDQSLVSTRLVTVSAGFLPVGNSAQSIPKHQSV